MTETVLGDYTSIMNERLTFSKKSVYREFI